MAVFPNTLSGANVGVERFRVSDEVVLEMLERQNRDPLLRGGLVEEIRKAEARVD